MLKEQTLITKLASEEVGLKSDLANLDLSTSLLGRELLDVVLVKWCGLGKHAKNGVTLLDSGLQLVVPVLLSAIGL